MVSSPASGSRRVLANVGVLAAPCMVTLPRLMRPLPTCAGSAAVSMGRSAMTISAVTPAATGAPALPTSRRPSSRTVRVTTFMRVSASVANRRAPRISTQSSPASLTAS